MSLFEDNAEGCRGNIGEELYNFECGDKTCVGAKRLVTGMEVLGIYDCNLLEFAIYCIA